METAEVPQNLGDVVQRMAQQLSRFPKHWDGKKCILQMREEGFSHWKQMEWIGFYFQFLCEKIFQITDKILVKCGSFQEDFRNSNGKPRRRKVLLDLEKLDDELIYVSDF
jgi:hypothetical protein